MGEQPCREFEIFRERTEMEFEERKKDAEERRIQHLREHQEQNQLIKELKDLVAGQNIRIFLLEQQNKLIFWLGSVITTALIVSIISLIFTIIK